MIIDGKTIKKYREYNNITRSKMATILKIAPTTINNYESNKNNIPQEIIDKYIRLYGISKYILYNDIDNKAKNDIVNIIRIYTLNKKINWVHFRDVEEYTLSIIKKAYKSIIYSDNTDITIDIEEVSTTDLDCLNGWVFFLHSKTYILTTLNIQDTVATILFETTDNKTSIINTSIINSKIKILENDILYSKGFLVERKPYLDKDFLYLLENI